MPEPPRTGEAVLDLVRKSDVVDVGALSAFVARSGPHTPPSAADTAKHLIEAGLLTPFQAKLILQGKYRGFRIGTYRILDQIATGGMGQVFLGEHTTMKRRVAIKILPARLAIDPGGVERFYREARAIAALDHPNIVRAYDVGCDKGTHYLVLEYVEGRTVDQRLKEAGGRLPWGEAVGYAVQAAAGLKHAHDRGLVHRDVKPANLLIDREGVIKVLDLGLARFFEDDQDRLTRNLDPNSVMGTADYVAPEQLLDSEEADYRADVYALGATLYHLVAGQTPFQGSTTAKLVAHQLHFAPQAHTVSEVPEELSEIIDTMMAKQPDERYANMGEVVAALLPFVAPADPSSGTGSSLQLPPIALAAVSQTTSNLATAMTRANRALQQDKPPASRATTFALIGAAVVLVAGSVAIAVAIGSGRLNIANSGTNPDPNSSGLASPNSSALNSGGHTPPGSPQATDPTAPVVAYILAGHTGQLEDVLFTPDGRVVTVGNDKTIRVWNPQTGAQMKQFAVPLGTARGLAMVGMNRLVVTFTSDPVVRTYDLNSGKELWQFSGHSKGVISVAALPDGRRFLTCGHDGTVRLWDTESGQEQDRFTMKSAAHGLAVTPDGTRFLVGCADRTVRLWSLQKHAELRRTAVSAIVWRIGVSADGTRASFGNDARFLLWDLTTGDSQTFAGPTKFVDGTAFTRDGRYLLAGSGDRSLYVWDVVQQRIVTRQTDHTNAIRSVAISPDGRFAATSSTDGNTIVWRLPATMLPK